MKLLLIYIFVIGSFTINSINSSNVPVLLWDNAKGSAVFNDLESNALKSYTEIEFSKLMRRNILTTKEDQQQQQNLFTIIFTEKVLTTEDLNSCKITTTTTKTKLNDDSASTTSVSCYKELQSLHNKIVYLSNVENPIKILKSIAYASDKSQTGATTAADNHQWVVKADSTIKINEILPIAGQFLFIELSEMDKSGNDRLMKELTEHLTMTNDKIRTLFIYTGKDTTENNRYVREAVAAAVPGAAGAVAAPATPGAIQPQPQPQQQNVSNPSTKQQEPLPTQFFDESTVIVYTTATYQYTAGSDPIPIVFETIASSRNPETNVISVNFTSTSSSANTFGFEIHTVAGRWSVKSPYFNNIPLRTLESIGANGNFSYRCSPLIKFYSGNNLAFGWEGIQLQPVYGDAPLGRFGDPWDCVGFTSAGIWGGLFVTILLLSILSVGLTWIMDIRTMDRFDDPKGKTIIVTVAE